MKLRWKTLFIIGIMVISVLLVLMFVYNLLMLNGVGAMEQKDTRREAEIIVDSVEHELEDLDATTADYAAWDDTYTFVQDGNLDYINLNLMDATFVNLRLNIMLFVNSTNQVVFGKAFDLQNETELPFPQGLTQHLVDNVLLLSHNTTASSMKGAIAIVEGPLLIASRPILTSQREGPIRGTLITGRFLDSVEMNRLYHAVHLPLVLQIVGHPWISSDFQEAYASLSKEEPIFVSTLSRETIAGYALFEDIYGNPISIVRIDLPRDNYAQGVTGVVNFVFALAAVGAIFAVVTMLLLEKFVISRLSRLSRDVQSIGKKPDSVARVSVAGTDELSDLSGEINKMLSRLAYTEEKLKEERDRVQEYLDIAGVMIVALDVNGKITLLNRKGCEILECTIEKALGKSWFDTFIPARNRHQNSEIFQSLMNGELIVGSLEYNENLVLTLSGKERLIAWHNVVIHNPSGQIIGTLSSGSDITGLKQAEKALYDSESRFRRITENMLDIVSQTDMSGIFQYVSPSTKRVLGYEAEEMLRKSILDFVHPGDVAKVTNAIQESVNACSWGKMEFRYRHADGHYLWLETIGNFLCNDKGKPVGAVFNSRDVTERKQMEIKLQHTTKRLETLLTTASEGIVTADVAENITFANKAFADIVGYEDKELVGRNFRQLLDEEGFKRIKEETELRQKGETSRYELRFYRKNGEYRTVQLSASPLWNDVGTYVGSLGIVTDMTERKYLEQALQESNTLLRQITDNMFDMVSLTDAENIYRYVSPSAKRTLGYEPKDLLGKTIFDFLHPDDCKRVSEAVEATTRTRSSGNIEYRYRHADGHYLWLEGASNVILDDKGQIIGAVLSSHDISERKRIDEELQKSQQKFEKLFDSNPEAAAFVDANDHVLEINPRFTEVFGYSSEEAKGKTLDDLIVPEEKKEEARTLTKESLSGYVFHETVRRTKNGLQIPVFMSAAPITIENQLTGCVVSYRDITDRKDMEERLRVSEEKFRGIAERSFDAIAIVDMKGTITYASPSVGKVLGYPQNEVMDKSFLEYFSPAKLSDATQLFAGLAQGKNLEGLQLELSKIDGTMATVEINASPIILNGEVAGIQAVFRDITERRRMEKALMESEEKYRLIFENVNDVVFAYDSEFVVLSVSPSVEKTLGYKPEELVGKKVQELNVLAPESLETASKNALHVLEGERISPSVYEFVKKDGTKGFGEITSSPLIREGKIIGVIAVARDITERRQMEEEIRESEEKLKQFLEFAPDAIYVTDINGVFLDGNKQAEIMTGYSKKELVGKSIVEAGLLPEEHVSKAIELIQKSMNEQKTGPDEMELIRKDGSRIWVEISSMPVKRGDRIEVLGIARDTTDRKRIENALREAEEKTRNILQSSPDAIVVTDLNGTMIDCNQEALKLAGVSTKEEFLGKNTFDLISPRDHEKSMKNMEMLLERGTIRDFEFTLIAKNGREFPAEVSMSLMCDHTGEPKYFVATLKDITERKEMLRKLEEYSQQLEDMVEKRTKQLKEAQEQLVKAERLAAIGQVAAMVGHDLRNPLTGIKGATYYLKTRLVQKMDAKSKEMVELIERDVEYSNKIITDLMDYSREIRLEFFKTSPKSIMNETLSVIQVPESVKVLDLTQDSIQITLDIDKMKRVFANLTKNAIDAMPRGGKITISSRESGGNVEFIFKDTGTGIAKEIVEKIWTPFFTTKAKGMGLGLAICKRVIEAHGGRIFVESIVGEGTTFTIILPVEPKTKEEGGEKVWVNLPESLSSTMTKASEKS